MMTGISGALALIAASRSRPLTPGMRMSVMIASGCVRASSSATPSAESKQRTAMPACSSAFSSTQRMERSSSLTHTVSGLAIGALERQVDGEDGLARAARALDQAAVAADDVLGDGQTEPRAFRPAGDHGVENVLLQVLGYPRAVVLEIGAQHQAVALMADREVAFGARADLDDATVLDRLGGVAHDVEHRLDQLLRVALQLRQARVVIALDGESDGRLDQHQAPHVLEDLVEVDRLFLERLVRADDAIHQVAQPVGLVNDDAGILLEPLVGELALDQP